MKLSFLFILVVTFITAGCSASPVSGQKVLLAQTLSQNRTQQIARVQAGSLKVANASWWGFTKEDATNCLQDAINSRVPKLIVDNTGSDWVINKPISLVSGQRIVFADGVVIQAKKDCFKGTNDSLFSGKRLTHIALIGQGKVILRMHREDYANPNLYKKAEWRHGIALSDCSDVTIRNLTITQTGGDGLYLSGSSDSYCKDVLVEDMIFDANYRLGMGVISVDGLTIRRCKFVNTLGTNPQGGIDFEPNHTGQRLTNCIIEDCIFANNVKGRGVDIVPMNLTGSSQPLSIIFRRCKFSGNNIGLATNPSRSTTIHPITGIVQLIDCHFDHNQISLRDPVQGSIQYLFKDCILDFNESKKSDSWKNVPIVITTGHPPAGRSIGNIIFDHTTVINNNDSIPISIQYQGKATLSNTITGDVYLQNGNRVSKFDLVDFIKDKQAEFRKINAQKAATIDLDRLQAPPIGKARINNNQFYLRGKFTFLQYAQKGEEISITVIAKKVYPRETTVDLVGPDGKKIRTYPIPLDDKPILITFTASETGLYRVVREQDFSQRIDITSANRGTGLLSEEPLGFLPLSGRLYFQVPSGVRDFSLGISSYTSADVALIDPNGKEVVRHNNINSLQLFSATRADASKTEIWSIDVSKAVWSVTVNMYEPLIPIVSTNPSTLLLAPGK